jgi:trimethylamine--corrinoid protein Co-methyltransferase
LFDSYLGEEGGFLKRPFCTFGGCPIISPLRFGKDNAQVLVKLAELGLVGDVAVAPQAGATAPAALAGTHWPEHWRSASPKPWPAWRS